MYLIKYLWFQNSQSSHNYTLINAIPNLFMECNFQFFVLNKAWLQEDRMWPSPVEILIDMVKVKI